MPYSDNGGEPFFLHVRRSRFQLTAEGGHDHGADTALHRTAALFSRGDMILNPVIAFIYITYYFISILVKSQVTILSKQTLALHDLLYIILIFHQITGFFYPFGPKLFDTVIK